MSHELRADLMRALGELDAGASPAEQFCALARRGSLELPFPGAGQTIERWQVLCDVAAHDLSVVKLFEGHTDALAIMRELHHQPRAGRDATWGVWAAEPPGGRLMLSRQHDGSVRLNGLKLWCSGAHSVSHALTTAWQVDGAGPYLVSVEVVQPTISISDAAWQAVGMADSGSMDVHFDNAIGEPVGLKGDYVTRAGFMHGGAGIAACWYGGAAALAAALHRAVAATPDLEKTPFRVAALGRVDMALAQTAALLRETAAWIDRWPGEDATAPALRARQSAEACARTVMDEVGRALGATPFCRDRRFARMVADLAVFTRQSLADRDFQALGARVAATSEMAWPLEVEGKLAQHHLPQDEPHR